MLSSTCWLLLESELAAHGNGNIVSTCLADLTGADWGMDCLARLANLTRVDWGIDGRRLPS